MEQNELSEFTKKAMQMAREQEYNERERADSGNYFSEQPQKHTVHLYLSDDELKQLFRLMDLGVSKSREAITRCERFPTDSIRSSCTIERHEKTIEHIEALRIHLAEESQW